MTRWLLVLPALLAPVGCGLLVPGDCNDIAKPNLWVEVRDAETGEPAARGATGVAVHQSGTKTELTPFWSELTLGGSWDGERAGRYDVFVRKPGFEHETATIDVDEGWCHVETETVRISLEEDLEAEFVEPASERYGEDVPGEVQGLVVRARDGVMEITGAADASCSDLTAVAARSGDRWHVQLEPEPWPDECRSRGRSRAFEVTYDLPPGGNHVLVTSGFGFPTVLFSGRVTGR